MWKRRGCVYLHFDFIVFLIVACLYLLDRLLKSEYRNWVYPWLLYIFNSKAHVYPGKYIRYGLYGSFITLVLCGLAILWGVENGGFACASQKGH